ncbi:MAG: ABC transporter ATP-binding protein [Planctomycetota bacterium]|jgi:oligopeptide/dipeptide ABC transporter ATP-binding protein
MSLLAVDNLSIQFGSGERAARAVNNSSFHIEKGETVGIVGESGCGKSVTGLSLLRLIEYSGGTVTEGEIIFDGKNLINSSEKEMRSIRGTRIAMIFQEPMTSFNPVFTIGDQLTEAILIHEKVSFDEAWDRSIEMLTEVGIPLPERRMEQYPHELSGGMKQRAMIAMALLGNPDILIADEPTTALDVTVQAQILDLLKKLQQKNNMAVILITHDLSVVAETCDRVYVMYASKIVESASTIDLFKKPLHPYTTGLFNCLPRIDLNVDRLKIIDGTVPDPRDFPSGCKFHPRCPKVQDICRDKEPLLENKSEKRLCACHFAEIMDE